MIDSIAFQTMARTVDHLGREQIADCPTAISELWKNSYDAYARTVSLDLYSGSTEVAVMSDDGHGMSREEFISRWLVVGTESKTNDEPVPLEDRNGLRTRPKLGQKGIGRLSCANLGPTLLLISKRSDSDFVVSLIDWRLFENPFSNLADIEVPVISVAKKEGIFAELGALASRLLENVVGGGVGARSSRIHASWKRYDEMSRGEGHIAPSIELSQALRALPFSEEHLKNWPVWDGKSDHGTAMLVTGLNFDLQVLLQSEQNDVSANAAKARFVETLQNFVDPFTDEGVSAAFTVDPQFSYSVSVWTSLIPRFVVSSGKEFTRTALEGLEHQIDGIFDRDGVFKGRVKVFGKWLDEFQVINPPTDLRVLQKSDSVVGPFGIYIAAMEFEQKNTSLTASEYQHFKQLAERYAGFLVFRDGLRVLPYGRTDSDYFSIDDRRSKHAGRYFWNNRQMFGRVAITRSQNPNLRDKAGREGILDNRSAKIMRQLVMNLLIQAARRYFGSVAEYRKIALPDNQAAYAKQKAEAEKEKLRGKNNREFQKRLKAVGETLPLFRNEVTAFATDLLISEPEDIEPTQIRLEAFRSQLALLSIPPPTAKQSKTMAARYEGVRADFRITKELISEAEAKLTEATNRLKPANPLELLKKQADRNERAYKAALRTRRDNVQNSLQLQLAKMLTLEKDRAEKFAAEIGGVLQRFQSEQITFTSASALLAAAKESSEFESDLVFQPFQRILEILEENIDLNHLINFGLDEENELRGELERITGLAQLGVAVEISGHELQDYEQLIAAAFSKLPPDIRSLKPIKDIEFGVEGLTDQMRFLSPMRIAGQKVRARISGIEIMSYLKDFFKLQLASHRIDLTATAAFENFWIMEFASRLFPAFINLVNNAIYWVSNSTEANRQIVVDVVGSEVVISDNGPGVNEDDRAELFKLFFTRKNYGGRGVGLYLTRSNLMSGGHKIRYVSDVSGMPLNGANFAINFQGAEFG